MSINIKDLIKKLTEHKNEISILDKSIKPLYNQMKKEKYNNSSVEYNLRKIVIHLQKWKHQIHKNQNKLIDEINKVSNDHRNDIIKINVVQLKDLQEEHESICKNQLMFIRFLNE
jgi:uncharacterized coiled-coil protein SlyX